jgi:hypothetical protein
LPGLLWCHSLCRRETDPEKITFSPWCRAKWQDHSLHSGLTRVAILCAGPCWSHTGWQRWILSFHSTAECLWVKELPSKHHLNHLVLGLPMPSLLLNVQSRSWQWLSVTTSLLLKVRKSRSFLSCPQIRWLSYIEEGATLWFCMCVWYQGLNSLFAQTGFEPQSSCSLPPE